MVVEPWILKMGNQVSANLKHALLLEAPKKGTKKQDVKETIGILSFEVANVMSKTVILHKYLVDNEIVKLKGEIFSSDGIKALISADEAYLLELALAEKLDELNRVAGVVSRLGKKCSVPALQGFEHVYGDIVGGVIEVRELGFLVKDMEGMIKKMEKYVNSTANLYGEMAVLGELEQATKKFQQTQHEESRRAFEQKLAWQKQDVGHLKDVSLWNQTYDKVVELLARTVCTLYVRICHVFGKPVMRREFASGAISGTQFRLNGSFSNLKEECGLKSGQIDVKFGNSNRIRRGLSKNYSYNHSGLTEKGLSDKRELNIRPQVASQRGDMALFRAENHFACGVGPGRLLMECLSLSSSASKVEDDDDDSVGHDDRSSQVSGCCSVASGVKRGNLNQSGCYDRSLQGSVTNSPKSSPRSRLMTCAPPSTVGGSALALHYANVIIIIEKLLRYPHLVGEEARDDLYYMLPTSLKMSLKISLKSYIKDLAIFDAPLADGWKQRLGQILKWLAPMAHNMIRWQSERNFEQQQIVTRTNVLLLQTLYFADRAKTEAAICELLVGLNYICRYEHQQNALLDCASSFDFDDGMDWQLQH